MATLTCPECESEMILREGKHGKFYGCSSFPACSETHGAHQESGKPLGIPANKETREHRSLAHKVFDRLWQGKQQIMSRRKAYSFMREALSVEASQAHIAMCDIEQCKALIAAVHELRKQRKDDNRHRQQTKHTAKHNRKRGVRR